MPANPAVSLPASQDTCHAPACRASHEEVLKQGGLLDNSPLVRALLDTGAGAVLILNSQRQVIAAGSRILQLVSGRTLADLLGLRPGEAMNCIHSADHEGGCGCSVHCRECGAVRAILAAVDGHGSQQECRILHREAGGHIAALDLRVHATPFEVAGEHMVILALSDISHEKRRKALEKTFFHDVINLAGGIHGLLEVLQYTAHEDMKEALNLALGNVKDLVEEIQVQRDLVAAERNELKANPTKLHSTAVLQSLMHVYQAHPVCRDKHLSIHAHACDFELTTDPILLRRIIGNMIKNACEASPTDAHVTLDCRMEQGANALFSVHNPGFIPESVRMQIFQRSFSTKGEGRGLGTYSIKLLGERYLHGQVSFSSDQAQGTVFSVRLPVCFPDT